ncbi:MAG: hypothetical protein RJQ04_08575 [Longimicrobiales bacterium]
MTDDPSPTGGSGGSLTTRPAASVRRFSDEEVARILRSAADLQERSSAHGGVGSRGLTLDDLRQVAAEVGIDPRFVDAAATESHGPPARESSALAGGTYAWSVHRTVSGHVPEDERDRIVRAIRHVIGQKGELEDVYGRMEWSYDDGLGPIMVGLASRDGVTEIDVSVRRIGEVGLWFGLGMPFGGIFGGAAVGAGLLGLSGPAVLPIIAAMAVVSYGGMRALWSILAGVWERKVHRLADAVTGAAQDVAVMPPPSLEEADDGG